MDPAIVIQFTRLPKGMLKGFARGYPAAIEG